MKNLSFSLQAVPNIDKDIKLVIALLIADPIIHIFN